MFFKDPSDSLAGATFRKEEKPSGIVLFFKHVPTGVIAEFKAFIEDFSDSFNSSWNGQEVWGRMDDIQTFKNTKRAISISWTVPSHSEEEAISNFGEVSKMTGMLYPVYEDLKLSQTSSPNIDLNLNSISDLDQLQSNLLSLNLSEDDREKAQIMQAQLERISESILSSNKNTSTIPKIKENVSLLSSPPIIQFKFKNLVTDDDDNGLYGKLDGFDVKPDFEGGTFLNNGKLIPMVFRCSVTFTVIHSDKLGWDSNKKLRTSTFPYRVNKGNQ